MFAHTHQKVEVAVLKALERPFLFPAERALLRRIIDKHTRTQVQSTTLGHSQSLVGGSFVHRFVVFLTFFLFSFFLFFWWFSL